MKRFLSLFLCVLLLLTAVLAACDNEKNDVVTSTTAGTTMGTTAGTSATTTVVTTAEKSPYEIRDIASSLISNWDFSGSSQEDMLSDKASKGASSDKISIFGSGVTVSNGLLSIKDGEGNYASIAVSKDSDFYDLKNKTLVFKVRLSNTDGNASVVSGLLSKEGSYDVFFSKASNGRQSQLTYTVSGEKKTLTGGPKTDMDKWIEYALSVEVSDDNKAGKIILYRSNTETTSTYKDFDIVFEEKITNVSEDTLAIAKNVVLGKRWDHTNAARGLNSEFSCIQLYDMVLNVAEIASISLENSSASLMPALYEMITKGEAVVRDPLNTDYEWNALQAAIAIAKTMTASTPSEEIIAAKNNIERQIAILKVTPVPNYVGDFKMIPYNNPELKVPIQTGLHQYPGLWDIDGDGDMDFIGCGFSTSYFGKGTGMFACRNLTGSNGTTTFGNTTFIQYYASKPVWSTKVDGSPVFVTEEGVMHTELTNAGYGEGKTFAKLTTAFKLYDLNSDGLSDAVYVKGASSGTAAYDKDGNWLKEGTSSLYWIKNTGTEADPDFSGVASPIRNKQGQIFTVDYGSNFKAQFRGFSMADWDGDGDLDLIAGGSMNEYYYYENHGGKKAPVFENVGVKVETVDGPLQLDSCRYQIINYDWDGDGKSDIMIGGESGTTLYFRFTGNFNQTTGAPIFEKGEYFTKPADYLAVNALTRVTFCDIDGDGDQDIIAGDAGGQFYFFENLTGGSNPTWAAPVKIKDETGKFIVIKAGYNGSLQGAHEADWGYVIPSAADWDGDGDFDIIVNSITGRVQWLENIGTATAPQFTQPKAIEVEWENGNLYPTWQWWTPEGKELVTQHRSTMYAIDFTGDGLCDLVGLDYQGYLVLYERYNDNGTLKLKQGARIFVDASGKALQLNSSTDGASGRVKLAVTDWNCDGMLDILTVKYADKTSPNAELYITTKTQDGKCYLSLKGNLGTGDIHGHHQGVDVVDWDGDGDPDAVIGTESGYFYYFENKTK